MKVKNGTLWEATTPVTCWRVDTSGVSTVYGGFLSSGSFALLVDVDNESEHNVILTERGVLFVDFQDFHNGFKPAKQLNTKKR
jgi:hypothetical protein